MTFLNETVRPIVLKLSRWHWIGMTIVLGIFFTFASALLIGAFVGMLGLEFPWYFGVITSLFGLFALGYFLGRLAPREFFWEFPVGTVLFALLFMGLTSQGAGALAFLAKGVLVPVLAGAVGYLGVTIARRGRELNETPSHP